jgi:tetratricopeptide (TPR) repeat protein
MTSLLRRLTLTCGLLALAAIPVLAGIPISVQPGKQGATMDEKALNSAMQDAFTCVADVLAYRPGEAEAPCSGLIAAAPEEALGYKFRGLAYLLEHRFDKAEEDFHAAVRLAPKDPENQAGYAQSMAGQGRYAEAIPRFEAALRIAPRDIRYLAASCWARAGEGSHLDLALRDCNKALQISPQFATALQNRGLVRLKQKNWRTAIQDYSRALVNDGDRPTALFGRGFANLQIGEKDSAKIDIQAARRISPEIDDLYILQKVLPASCRDASGACPLPDDLRQPSPSTRPLLMVSHQETHRYNPSGFKELDETIRTIELGRLDAMLDRTATLLGVKMAPTFSIGWQDAELPEAKRHLTEVRVEYQYQQRLACTRKLIGGDLCKTPIYGTAIPFITDSPSLRREIDHTVDFVQPFWHAVCLASHELADPCEIE